MRLRRALGASRETLGSRNQKRRVRKDEINMIYVKKVRFRVPFWGHWILKGVPKSQLNLSARHLYKESFVAQHLFEKQKQNETSKNKIIVLLVI